MDHRVLRDVFGLFTTGVTVVTAVGPDGEPVGITANSVTSVSLEPPLILWCLASASSKLAAFAPGMPFAVHILAADQSALALQFARRGTRWPDDASPPGVAASPPQVPGAIARIECRTTVWFDGGDHKIILGAIEDLQAQPAAPLVFHASRFGTFTDRPLADLAGLQKRSAGPWD
jgi:flavin reductase (DIM6/NTAB) family NADH-FMN oxidoreductase RutF